MAKQTTQFWLGSTNSEDILDEFVEETFNEDDQPISKFAASQNETYVDHDFMERGFEPEGKTFKEKFCYYSYSNVWMEKLLEMLKGRDITHFNVIIMSSYKDKFGKIDNPSSYKDEKITLEYIGEIEYDY